MSGAKKRVRAAAEAVTVSDPKLKKRRKKKPAKTKA